MSVLIIVLPLTVIIVLPLTVHVYAIKTKFTDGTKNSDCSRQVVVFQDLHCLPDRLSRFQGIDK